MPSHPGRFLILSLILLILFLVGVKGSLAESAYSATLTVPDTSDFPHLTAYLDVHDPTGAFVHGLSPQDVTLQENGVQLSVSGLQEQTAGVQFVMAITPGDTFTARDGLGVSRYEYLLQGLLAGTWVDQPSGLDDFSLLTMGGSQLTHSTDPAALRSSLEAYTPDDPDAIPGLQVLSAALQVVAAPTIRPGMERAILFITSPQPGEVSLGLQSIITTAIQQNIHIFVWLLAYPEVFDLPETDLLRNLADQTHATFFAFSQEEPVPDLEALLEPLRYIYQLGYDSQITTPGAQQVAAQVTITGELVTTQPQSFELNLQAPVPMLLLAPNTEIVRTFSHLPTPGVADAETDIVPTEQIINIQVTYPDGYDRPLARSSLYVDGTLAAENTAPPFDQFVWDLRLYSQDGVHTLSVEVVDSLGGIGKSADTSVKITLPTTTQGIKVVFSQKRLLVTGTVILISASILVLVLILGGRIHPKPYPGQVKQNVDLNKKTPPVGYRQRLRQRRDPVTQPVKIASTPQVQTRPRSKNWKERLPWLKPKEKPSPAIAHILPLVVPDETTLPAPMQIIAEDVSLGSDPLRANLVIADPSIEGLHARIHHEDKSFLITDAGSVAGTWVNYAPVPSAGTQLEHADIIHLGRVGFRFMFAEPGELRKIVITRLEPDK